jgi:hypothetical protein
VLQEQLAWQEKKKQHSFSPGLALSTQITMLQNFIQSGKQGQHGQIQLERSLATMQKLEM